MNTKNIYLSKALFLLIFFSFNVSANIELVTVKVKGEGLSKEVAVENALMRAVSQINGFEVDSVTKGDYFYANDSGQTENQAQINKQDNSASQNVTDVSALININANLGPDLNKEKVVRENGLSKESFYQTQGLIKSWKVVSESQSSFSDSWQVEVEVTIEKITDFKLTDEVKRKRIAISPFRTANQNFSRFFEESLNSYLAQSGKFAVFDRKYTQEQSSELKKYRGSDFRKGEVSRIGNMLGVDYIVVGNIAEFKEKITHSLKLKTISKPFTKKKIFVDISYRVIDVATGQVKYSGYIAKDFLKNKNYSIINLSRKIAGLIGQKITNSIYPITVMQVDGDMVVLAQGGDTLLVGDKFNLIQYGKEFFDPYTNESLGYSENRIGVIEVLDVQSKLSTARVVSLNVQKLNTSSRMIVRPVLKKKEATTSPAIRNINLPKATVKVKDIDKDGDW